jgi:tetratricopeptide (TPR) repeat protein
MRPTGLLSRAKAIRASSPPPLRLLGPHELRVDDDEISAEDREQALAQVEQAMASSREAIAPETLAFRPRRGGGLLPLLANLLALVVIAGGIVLALRLSRQAEQDIAAGPATLLSAEGRVLEVMREESRRELEGKDRQIAEIRGRLAGIDGERQRIRQAAEDQVRDREQELAASFARALEQERSRLAAGGLSEDAVARKLIAFEAAGRRSMEDALATFREEQQAELARSEQAIEALQAEYSAELSRAQEDRNRIQEDARRRQSELEAGYRQKQLALEQDKAAALAELVRLRGEQERERLASDQLLGFYARARDEIAADRPAGALAAMADLRRYLDEPGIASLPAMARRRPVDVFLAASLEQMVRDREAGQAASRDMQGLVASAGLVAAAAALVEQGDSLFAEGDYARAREVYLSALARIPASEAGHARLAEIERVYAEREKRALAAAFAAGNAAYRTGDYEAAVERYGSALRMLQVERGVVDATVSHLIDIGSLRKASELAAAEAGRPDPAAEAAALVREGDGLAAGEEYGKARELYLAAIARIPATEAAREGLAGIEAMMQERASRAVSAALAGGNAAYAAGDFDAAVERYGLVLQLLQLERGAADGVVAQLVDIGTRREASRAAAAPPAPAPDPDPVAAAPVVDPGAEARARSAAWLEALRARLETPGASPSQVAETGDALVALLETKLLVQKTLLSPQVASQHPDLYDRLEQYLEALAEESRSDAQLAILRDIDGLLAEAGSAGTAAGSAGADTESRSAALAGSYPAAEQRGLLAGILERLQGLLR